MNIYLKKYLKYKNKYLNFKNIMIGGASAGGDDRINDNRIAIFNENTELLKNIDLYKCINSFIKKDNVPDGLLQKEKIIGSGVNGEVISMRLPNNNTIAVKTIPMTKNNYDKFIAHKDLDLSKDLNLSVVSAIAEIKALEICTNYVLRCKSPHFNAMYKYLLCENCKYIDTKVQETRFEDNINELYKIDVNKIRSANAILEGNSEMRPYRIKDIQQFIKETGNIIQQYCIYILNENADGDMLRLLTPELSFNDLKIYMFQIFSALNLCYINDEMSHHDLHCKNILFVNYVYNNVDCDLYKIIIKKDDGTEEKSIDVKLPLNGKMLRIWDFGRVNIQRKIYIEKST
jgi:hypothetical protein